MFRRMAGAVAVAALAAQAQWPQWRGPARDGVAEGRAAWPATLAKVWEREIGEGYSGPIIAGGNVWTLSRRGDQETAWCLRLATGEVKWTAAYAAPFEQDNYASAHGRGPFATPTYANGRVFTHGVTGVLSAWEAETGKLLWRKDVASEFPPGHPFYGAAGSPVVNGGLVYLHMGGHPRSNLEAAGAGAVVALREADGAEQWRWTGDSPAMGASPILMTFDKQPHLVVKTKKHIAGLDPATGAEWWRMDYAPAYDNSITTPLLVNGLMVTGDYDLGLRAWRIERKGAGWAPRQVWQTREVSVFNSTPVVTKGLIAGFSHLRKGQLFVLDPATGKVLWLGAPRGGEQATLVAAGEQVLVFQDDGSLSVGEASATGIKPVQKYKLGESGGWAHPGLGGGYIVTREGGRITAWGDVPPSGRK